MVPIQPKHVVSIDMHRPDGELGEWACRLRVRLEQHIGSWTPSVVQDFGSYAEENMPRLCCVYSQDRFFHERMYAFHVPVQVVGHELHGVVPQYVDDRFSSAVAIDTVVFEVTVDFGMWVIAPLLYALFTPVTEELFTDMFILNGQSLLQYLEQWVPEELGYVRTLQRFLYLYFYHLLNRMVFEGAPMSEALLNEAILAGPQARNLPQGLDLRIHNRRQRTVMLQSAIYDCWLWMFSRFFGVEGEASLANRLVYEHNHSLLAIQSQFNDLGDRADQDVALPAQLAQAFIEAEMRSRRPRSPLHYGEEADNHPVSHALMDAVRLATPDPTPSVFFGLHIDRWNIGRAIAEACKSLGVVQPWPAEIPAQFQTYTLAAEAHASATWTKNPKARECRVKFLQFRVLPR